MQCKSTRREMGVWISLAILVEVFSPTLRAESILPSDFPGQECGTAASKPISARFVELNAIPAQQRGAPTNLEFAQILLTLRLVVPLRDLMPRLAASEGALASAGLRTDYFLLKQAYDIEEGNISEAIKQNEEAGREAMGETVPKRIPLGGDSQAHTILDVTSAKLKPEQAARRTLLLGKQAMATQKWDELRKISRDAVTVSCEAPRTLLWQIGNLWLTGSYGIEKTPAKYLPIVRARLARARLTLYPDDPAILDLLELNEILAIEAKDAGAAKSAIDALVEFQRTGSAYNHLWGMFAEEFGERLLDAGFEDSAHSAFVGAFRAEAAHPDSDGVVKGLLNTMGYYALKGSAAFKKELYREILNDAGVLSPQDPNRYLIELKFAQTYEEDNQGLAAQKIRRKVYDQNYRRVSAQTKPRTASCKELFNLIDKDYEFASLEQLSRREEAYSRCVVADSNPVARQNLVLAEVLADEYRAFGKDDLASKTLRDYRERIVRFKTETDDADVEAQVAFDTIAGNFDGVGDKVESAKTQEEKSAWIYDTSVRRVNYILLHGEKPWDDITLATRLHYISEQAGHLGRQKAALEELLRVSDTLATQLRTHPDEAMGINLRLRITLSDAQELAGSEHLPVAADLERIGKAILLSSTFDEVCQLLKDVRVADFPGRTCMSTVLISVPEKRDVNGDAPKIVNAKALDSGAIALASLRGFELSEDWSVLPTPGDVELFKRLLTVLHERRAAADELCTLALGKAMNVAKFIAHVGPYYEQRDAASISVGEIAQSLRITNCSGAEGRALALDSSVLAIDASYRLAGELRPLVTSLAGRVRDADNSVVRSSIDWVVAWDKKWTLAEQASDASLHAYTTVRGTDNSATHSFIPRRAVLDAGYAAFRDLINANEFVEARAFLAAWLNLDRDWVAGELIANAFPESASGVRCVDLSGAPILSECLETYLVVCQQWLARKTPWEISHDPLNEMSVLAAMTTGRDQRRLVQAIVQIEERRAPELSRAARSLLLRFEARAELPDSFRSVESYEAALRRYRELDSEGASRGGSDADIALAAARAALLKQREMLEPSLRQLDDFESKSDFSLPTLQEALGSKDAAVAFYIGNKSSVVVLVRRDGVVALPLGVTSESLAQSISALRSSELKSGLTYFDGAFAAGDSYALYGQILQPVEAQLKDITHLLIDPGPVLFQLPFALLVTSPPPSAWSVRSTWTPEWLASKYALCLVPQLTLLSRLRKAYVPSAASRQLFLGGDPKLTGSLSPFDGQFGSHEATPADLVAQLAPLEGAAGEIETLKGDFNLGSDAVLSGAEFTKRRFIGAALHEYRAIVLATHAVGATNDEPAFLVFTPESKTGPANDAILLPSEAALLSLDANLVVLSACRTGTLGAGRTDYNSLISAFSAAGARSIVATHWLVQSDTAARITTQVVREAMRSSGDLSVALQKAMQSEIGSSGASRHPAFWAPFFLWGVSP